MTVADMELFFEDMKTLEASTNARKKTMEALTKQVDNINFTAKFPRHSSFYKPPIPPAPPAVIPTPEKTPPPDLLPSQIDQSNFRVLTR
jgi:hypothetical protein